jgi:sugar/nucleoside kinase (ribokinase family)
MIAVLGDLIADVVLHIDQFPVGAGDLKRVEYTDIGPGGATNVAITAARLGMRVGCLGEVGDDPYAGLIIGGLVREEVDISGVVKTPGANTPVAYVIVDSSGEPAYVGYRGTLQLGELEGSWHSTIAESEALYVDGWADHAGVERIVLDGLKAARDADVPSFFDPGPGNREFSLKWHSMAASLATVLLLNEAEAIKLSGTQAIESATSSLMNMGPELIFIKRGVNGCLIRDKQGQIDLPGLTVGVVDTTGAGDSFNAAVMYGYLSGYELKQIGTLANAVGAAKAMKPGTGHNMPSPLDISSVLENAGLDPDQFL